MTPITTFLKRMLFKNKTGKKGVIGVKTSRGHWTELLFGGLDDNDPNREGNYNHHLMCGAPHLGKGR